MNATTMQEIEKQAAEWILRRDRGDVSEENRAALEKWLAQDARHRDAYLALDEFWDLTVGMKQWRPRDGRLDPDLLLPFAKAPERSSTPRLLSIAAMVLVIVGGLSWLSLSSLGGERYSTPIGGYERVALEDGSILQLNTDTVVKTRLTESRRSVQLLRGEAYFDVAQDPRRPFEVHVGKAVARALGTAFSIRASAGEQLELVVTQGRVLLLPDDLSGKPPLIVAGQSARAQAKDIAVASLASEEMRRKLAWQSGQLAFERQPLSQVVAEFNRYNRRQVRIASEDLSNLRLTGNFKATDLESFIAAVASAADVQVDRTDTAVVIRSR